ncbi:MAG TPA: lactonase family protein [Polyangia bacterium]|jgi:6-phosphogluconolactonase|nr:lactonase family protein [Polyangia bacterium]
MNATLGSGCDTDQEAAQDQTAVQTAPVQYDDHATTVYIGTYTRGYACPPPPESGGECVSKGIYRATFNPRTGSLSGPVLAAAADNPSYLAVRPDEDFLYAVNEVGDFQGQNTGAVTAYAIGHDGSLHLVNQLPSHGADPAHISVTASGRHVLVANYTGGNVSSYRIGARGELIDGNTVADLGQHGTHPNQDSAHAHFIVEGPIAGLIYVADLGLDRVFLYDLGRRSNQLSPHAAEPFVTLPPATGPRHIAFHPNKKFLYTNNELSTSASVFARNPHTGQLTEPQLQQISTIPLPFAGRNDNGEIQISRDGRFVYVSNRGHDSITTFSVNNHTGLLTMIDNVPSGGHEPRDFKIDPSGKFLLVAHHISDDMAVFRINERTGKVHQIGTPIPLSKPVNFAFTRGHDE